MEKPESYQYYDYWEVIRYLKSKHDLSDSIEDDFFQWLAERKEFHQNSIISLYMDDYLPQHTELTCEEGEEYDNCPCIISPDIRRVITLLKELEEEEITFCMSMKW